MISQLLAPSFRDAIRLITFLKALPGAVAILVLLMQIGLTIRLYVVSQPANSSAGATHQAREIGERMFNQSASCESLLDWD